MGTPGVYHSRHWWYTCDAGSLDARPCSLAAPEASPTPSILPRPRGRRGLRHRYPHPLPTRAPPASAYNSALPRAGACFAGSPDTARRCHGRAAEVHYPYFATHAFPACSPVGPSPNQPSMDVDGRSRTRRPPSPRRRRGQLRRKLRRTTETKTRETRLYPLGVLPRFRRWSGGGGSRRRGQLLRRCTLRLPSSTRHRHTKAPGAARGFMWRWRWDSNPRWSCPHTRFRGVLLWPLGHATVGEDTRYLPVLPNRYPGVGRNLGRGVRLVPGPADWATMHPRSMINGAPRPLAGQAASRAGSEARAGSAAPALHPPAPEGSGRPLSPGSRRTPRRR